MAYDRLGVIGAGQMAEAIVRGALEAKVLLPSQLVVSDPVVERRAAFEAFGVRAVKENLEVVHAADVLLVAVKPQNLDALLAEIAGSLAKKHLIISICAGCASTLFESASDVPVRIIRAMPNLPIVARMGATALSPSRYATQDDVAFAERVFGAAGLTVRVDESLMDAVTALSGSGPAYIFFLVEAMVEAGLREGLPESVARTLAVQTARGAAQMLATQGTSPQELRRRVTSKGGTTEAAFRSMEISGVREKLVEGIASAARRARELGRR